MKYQVDRCTSFKTVDKLVSRFTKNCITGKYELVLIVNIYVYILKDYINCELDWLKYESLEHKFVILSLYHCAYLLWSRESLRLIVKWLININVWQYVFWISHTNSCTTGSILGTPNPTQYSQVLVPKP